MDKLERLLKSVAYLKGKQIITKQQDIADAMNTNKSRISSALNGDSRYFTDGFIKGFCEAFPLININWVLNGSGKMSHEEQKEPVVYNGDKITIEGHELDFTSIEMAIYKNKERFTREGGVINLIVKDEVRKMFEKIVRDNNLEVKYTVKG